MPAQCWIQQNPHIIYRNRQVSLAAMLQERGYEVAGSTRPFTRP